MDTFEFNSIKAEKAEAMRRYNRNKSLKKLLFFVEVFAALAVLAWSSYTYMPVIAETASQFLRHYIVVLAKPLHVFSIINVLIIFISVLSSQKLTKLNFYDEYVTVTTNNSVPHRSFASSTTDHFPIPEDIVIDKQIIWVDNAVHSSPVGKNRAGAIPAKDCQPKRTVSPVQQKKVEEITETKKFRRTRSKRLDKENHREFGRSETAIHREVASRRSCEMDDLSTDTFNGKAEKTEAMRSYNRHKSFKKLFFFVEVFAALAVLSWSSYTYMPVIAEMASKFVHRYIVALAKPLYVFSIINVLIIFISVLSPQEPTKLNFYGEYVTVTTNNSVLHRSFASSATDHSPIPEDAVIDKQIICVGNAVHNSPVGKNRIGAIPAKDYQPKRTVSPVQQKKIRETKKCRRTRSERLDKENHRDFRRSETVIHRDVARRSCEMDDLSSEELKMKIETFISCFRENLIRENTLDSRRQYEKTHLTVKSSRRKP